MFEIRLEIALESEDDIVVFGKCFKLSSTTSPEIENEWVYESLESRVKLGPFLVERSYKNQGGAFLVRKILEIPKSGKRSDKRLRGAGGGAGKF